MDYFTIKKKQQRYFNWRRNGLHVSKIGIDDRLLMPEGHRCSGCQIGKLISAPFIEPAHSLDSVFNSGRASLEWKWNISEVQTWSENETHFLSIEDGEKPGNVSIKDANCQGFNSYVTHVDVTDPSLKHWKQWLNSVRNERICDNPAL